MKYRVQPFNLQSQNYFTVFQLPTRRETLSKLSSVPPHLNSVSAMASVPSISPQSLLPLSKLKPRSKPISKFSQTTPLFSRNKQKTKKSSLVVIVRSMVEELDVIPVQSTDSTDQQEGVVVSRVESEGPGLETELVSGFGASHEGRLSFEGAGFSSSGSVGDGVVKRDNEKIERLIDRTINATIVLAAGTFAITKLLTIDQDYWHVSHFAIVSQSCFCFCVFVKVISLWYVFELLLLDELCMWEVDDLMLKMLLEMVFDLIVHNLLLFSESLMIELTFFFLSFI